MGAVEMGLDDVDAVGEGAGGDGMEWGGGRRGIRWIGL